MEAKVLAFKQPKKDITAKLPNGVVLSISDEKINDVFKNPLELLTEKEKEGLAMLALAVIYTDHHTS